MRGRRPQPQAIKDQKAAVRSKRRRRSVAAALEVAAVPANASEAPAWLDGEGRQVWDRLAPTLRMGKLLTDTDTLTFARYCRNFGRWLGAQRMIDQHGPTYTSRSQWGDLKRINPAFLIADRLERQLLAAEGRFGLNPAERQRIYAMRAQTGIPGDLFGAVKDDESVEREGDIAAEPTAPAEPIAEPIGMLDRRLN